jgi:glyoxylase-like metal-dependent hydrolase (beta-lactamase superfamily II)/rhodanese-related sulfurtransferase
MESSTPGTPASETPAIEVADLLHRIDAGEGPLVLDVRNDEEFEAWRIEGRRPVETLHVPYFAILEDAAATAARLPRDRDIVVLCAQGGSSAMVVEMLAEAGVAARNVRGGMVAYGEYLQPVRVPVPSGTPPGVDIWQVNRRGKGCLSYIIHAGGEAMVVDASRDLERYESLVAGLGARIVRVLDTHVHADHLSGGPELARRSGSPYSVSAGAGFDLRHATEPLGDGQVLGLGGASIEVLATPGHTPGSTSFLVGRRQLLSGDTLFVRSVGRPDLGGHVVEWGRALFRTLRDRLAALADDVVVLPAHYAGPDEIGRDGIVSARLGDLRRRAGEFRIPTEDDFVRAMQSALRPPPASYAEIIRANLGPGVVDIERATEWELGKNQCAASAGPAAA